MGKIKKTLTLKSIFSKIDMKRERYKRIDQFIYKKICGGDRKKEYSERMITYNANLPLIAVRSIEDDVRLDKQ